jgi:hypothetical protein
MQTPAPSHRWGAEQALGPVGSRLPFATNAHCPTLPPRLQLLHVSVHATKQHTPSVQKPDAHSLVAAHAVPSVFLGAHAPALVQ